MKWSELKNQSDIKEFMDTFGSFHDSCLKELYMWTETYVNKELSMSMTDEMDSCVRILFQRQDNDPSAIELFFKCVKECHILSREEGMDSIIFEARLVLKDNLFYWAEFDDFEVDQPSLYSGSWLSSKELYWRDVSSWMGKDKRYGVVRDKESL